MVMPPCYAPLLSLSVSVVRPEINDPPMLKTLFSDDMSDCPRSE